MVLSVGTLSGFAAEDGVLVDPLVLPEEAGRDANSFSSTAAWAKTPVTLPSAVAGEANDVCNSSALSYRFNEFIEDTYGETGDVEETLMPIVSAR